MSDNLDGIEGASAEKIPTTVADWTLKRALKLREEVLSDKSTRTKIISVLWDRLDEGQQEEFLNANEPLKVFLRRIALAGALPVLGQILILGKEIKRQVTTRLPIPTQALRAWWVDLDDVDPMEIQFLIATGVLDCKGGEAVAREVTERLAKVAGFGKTGAKAVGATGRVVGAVGKYTGQGEVVTAGKAVEGAGAAGAAGYGLMKSYIDKMHAIRAEVQESQPAAASETVENAATEAHEDIVEATAGVHPPLVKTERKAA